MQYKNLAALASLIAAPLAAAEAGPHNLAKRQDSITWGPLVGLGPTTSGVHIVSAVSTIYPGRMPSTQKGGLYNWLGIGTSDTTKKGDLVQGIVGSYIHGQSECDGADNDKYWCVSRRLGKV